MSRGVVARVNNQVTLIRYTARPRRPNLNSIDGAYVDGDGFKSVNAVRCLEGGEIFKMGT